jgi:hypothetical protein
MNHSFIIRTKDELDAKEILKFIAEEYPIIVFKDEFPELSFVCVGRSSRPIQILKTDDGYEVRLLALSSEYDFYLVEDVVKLLCSMTLANGYDVLGEEVEDCDDFFIPQNFELRREDDIRLIKSAFKSPDSFIEFPDGRCNIFVGFDFLRRAGVTATSEDERFHGRLTAAMAHALLIMMVKSHNDDDIEIRSKDNPEQYMSVSCFRYPDDNNVDYLAFGELLTLEDARSENHVEILYDDFQKIAPDGWTLIDEVQYKVVPFTDQSWDELFNKAKELQWDGSFPKRTQSDKPISESNPMFNQPPELVGSSFGYDYHDGSHQDFGYSKEDVELLLEFGKAIESGTSDYYNQAFLECDLGILYEKGIGVEQDCYKAVYWYEKSAADGDDYARCNLADILRKGTGGVEKDWKRAFEVYKTVEQPYGPFRVGYMYEHGMGVEQDMNKAIEWYMKGHRHFLAAKRLRELGIDPDSVDDFI